MSLGVFQQIGEVLGDPALRAEQALENRHAADVVVVKMTDQDDIDPIDTEIFS